jgi:hypothetical protein
VIPIEFPIVAGALLTDTKELLGQLVASFRVAMGLDADEPQTVGGLPVLTASLVGKGGRLDAYIDT